MNDLASASHDATHQLPGVPAHRETQQPHRPSPRLRNRNPRLQNTDRHHQPRQQHQTPPRFLVAWQNWIGNLVGHNYQH